MTPLSDPTSAQSLVLAGRWIEQALLGTIATVIAALAVSVVGLLLLQGRLSWQRASTVLTGCFVLFGSVTIATGIMDVAEEGGDTTPYSTTDSNVALPPIANVTLPAQPEAYDPYAGPSVFVR